MEAGGEIIWSPDPGPVKAMTAVLCHRVSYDEGAKRQVTYSPPLKWTDDHATRKTWEEKEEARGGERKRRWG